MPRPRSAEAHQKVLKAALEMIAERGIEAASMDAIARVSGVSKATIYKHWKSKEDLCLEAIRCMQGEMPAFTSSDARSDVVKFLKHLAQMRKPETLARIWPRIASYAASNPAFAKAWSAHMMEPRRAILNELLGRAVARGELRQDLDPDLSMDLLIGPIMHRRFMNAAVPADVPERVAAAFWKSHARPN